MNLPLHFARQGLPEDGTMQLAMPFPELGIPVIKTGMLFIHGGFNITWTDLFSRGLRA